jgi:hypothetical protein
MAFPSLGCRADSRYEALPPLRDPLSQIIATGIAGEPVAPLNLVGNRMKQKLVTLSRASSSSWKFSIR